MEPSGLKTARAPYLTTLTPLRGIAALLVTLFHCNKFYRVFLPPGYTQFLENSPLWVDFFFILSGFILFHVYGRYFRQGMKGRLFKKYAGARFARVYPLYVFGTLWAFGCAVVIRSRVTALDWQFADMFSLKALGPCLLLIQSLHIGYASAPLDNPSWSLSTEWWVYMVFPFLVPYFARLKKRGKWLTGLAIVIFYLGLRYLEGQPLGCYGMPPNMITDFGLLRCLAGFATGMLLYTLYESRAGFMVMRRDWFFVLSFAGVLAALHFDIIHLVIIAFFPFVLISAAYNETAVKRFLDTRVLQRLGDWSFSIYMVHFPIIFSFYIFDLRKDARMFADLNAFFNRPPDYTLGFAMCLVILALTIGIASLTYRYIEVPARNYVNKVFQTNQPRINAEGVEV